MPRGKKQDAVKIEATGTDSIVLWKATRPLTQDEHEQLSQKLRHEQEQSGVKVILVPFSVEVEIKQDEVDDEIKQDDESGGEDK